MKAVGSLGDTPWRWVVCLWILRSLVVLRGRDQICEAPGRRVSEKVEGSTTTERVPELRRRAFCRIELVLTVLER